MAVNPFPYVITPLYCIFHTQASNAGKIIALDELIEQYAPNIKKLMEDLPELAAEMTSYDGHIYFIPKNLYGLNYHTPLFPGHPSGLAG